MAEHVLSGDSGIDTELLWQIPQALAYLFFLLEDIDLTQKSAATVRLLQRGQGSHEGGFAGAIGPK